MRIISSSEYYDQLAADYRQISRSRAAYRSWELRIHIWLVYQLTYRWPIGFGVCRFPVYSLSSSAMAESLTWLGMVCRRQGAVADAARLLDQSLPVHEAVGDQAGAACPTAVLTSARPSPAVAPMNRRSQARQWNSCSDPSSATRRSAQVQIQPI